MKRKIHLYLSEEIVKKLQSVPRGFRGKVVSLALKEFFSKYSTQEIALMIMSLDLNENVKERSEPERIKKSSKSDSTNAEIKEKAKANREKRKERRATGEEKLVEELEKLEKTFEDWW